MKRVVGYRVGSGLTAEARQCGTGPRHGIASGRIRVRPDGASSVEKESAVGQQHGCQQQRVAEA